MAKTKTFNTDVDVTDYINQIEDERKKADSFKLIEIMSSITGLKPYMFGPSIIGFGNYHYKYASGHEGDAPIAGFSPRKAAISLYVSTHFPGRNELLNQLGKHKSAVSCVYIKKLADIDMAVLEKMVTASVKHIKKVYPD
jgi:hypothetical protein